MRRRENAELKMKIYFDTCVYCRPFDDQSQERIEKETEAFARILKLAELGKVTIVSSDILIDELEEIVDPRKSIEVREFITICEEHVVFSEEIIKLAKSIEEVANGSASVLEDLMREGARALIDRLGYANAARFIAILGGEGDSVREIREKRMKSDIDEIAERIKRQRSGREMSEESKEDYY